MASHQYSLRWNNYVKHVSTAFEALRCDRDLVDVTLSCEGKKIPAHKMLLSACSSYFKSLFKENPCQHPVIIFRNVAFDDLMALVDFMYKGEVNVEQEQLASFLNTAELLEVQGLTNSGKDVEKSKTTVEEEKTVKNDDVQPEIAGVSLPYTAPFNESSQPSPSTSSTTTLRKRRRTSPARTEDESQPKIQAVDEPVIADIEHVPLKTEPEFEHIELQPDDSVDDEDLAASGIGLESSDMDNFVMAGPSNDSLGEDKEEEIDNDEKSNESFFVVDVLKVVEKNECRQNKYCCSACDRRFSTFSNCESHLRTHLGKATCPICFKSFVQNGDMMRHKVAHEGETQCDKCKKIYSSKRSLQRHMLKCTGVKILKWSRRRPRRPDIVLIKKENIGGACDGE
ncbi:zinc finger and BTB domain-containing protein 24-like isoform X2 [Neocloeon triangulifer]|uniref:zinc finger and BTB domain-containing protein 24-like isoform X2 n=1 Tax=Neocloeon triangulifer TaxID=2078957 RepID=UPI00286F540A|nr:zinc finger and BTB domain-containing protein 24-like isoform X2 [Neocloeon triangulifer]